MWNTGSYTCHVSILLSGSYLYINAQPRKENDVAIIRSPEMELPMGYGPICFVFFYHMYGSDMGELRMIREDANGQTELFRENGMVELVNQSPVHLQSLITCLP